MTEQHECNYCFGVRLTSGMVERLRDPACVKCDHCDNTLNEDEILLRLNEYETLKRATDCEWKYDEHHDVWETSCDNAFQMISGKPSGNYMVYCPYCAGKITEAYADILEGKDG